MSANIESQITRKKTRYVIQEGEDPKVEKTLDINKIQNSGTVTNHVTVIMGMANGQQEAINKELKDQHENTKDYAAFQQKMQQLNKESLQREQDYHTAIATSVTKIEKTSGKIAELDTQVHQKGMELRSLQGQLKAMQDEEKESKIKYEEQVTYKQEVFKKAITSKEIVIADLEEQIRKAQQQYEKTEAARFKVENDLKEKEEMKIKLNGRIDKVKALIEQKKENPEVKEKIEQFQKLLEKLNGQQNELKDDIKKKQQRLLELINEVAELENKKLDCENEYDQMKGDHEDREYLKNRINAVQSSGDQLKHQNEDLKKSLSGAQTRQGELYQTTDELRSIVNLAQDLNSYERTSYILTDALRDIEVRLLLLMEIEEVIFGKHINTKDELLHTIGKKKGSSTGGLGFLIKHALIDNKFDESRKEVEDQMHQLQEVKSKLQSNLDKILGKDLSQIKYSDLRQGIQTNKEVQKELDDMRSAVEKTEANFNVNKTEFENHQERLRKSYVTEVFERYKLSNDDLKECQTRLEGVFDNLQKFENDYQQKSKMVKSQERKEEMQRIHNASIMIKDESSQFKTNHNDRRTTLDKLTKSQSEVEKYTLPKLSALINALKKFEQQLVGDKKDVHDVEQRAKDLHLLFKDFIKKVIKEIINELLSKADQREQQFLKLSKKDQVLLAKIQDRHNQILGTKYHNKLNEISSEEEKAIGQIRSQIASVNKLKKQGQRINKDNFDIQETNGIIEELDNMESNINQNDQMLEGIMHSVNLLGKDTDSLEKQIKNERTNQCENIQRQCFICLEQLTRLLERIKSQMNLIEKELEYLVDEFRDMEKKKEGLSFKQDIDKKNKEWKTLVNTKDKLKQQVNSLEELFDKRQREKDTVSSGEFFRIRKEFERLKDDVQRQVDLVKGTFMEEIAACKETIEKIVMKYQTKKDKYNDCVELRNTREYELVEWKNKLMIKRDKIKMIEGQLNNLGISEDHEAFAEYKKAQAETEKLKNSSNSLNKQIQAFTEHLAQESQDLDQMEIKIVKTDQLEEIYKILEKLGIQIVDQEKEVEKFDGLMKTTEQENEAFINKVRSSQLLGSEQKLNEVQDLINALGKKVKEVGDEITGFKNNLAKENQGLSGAQLESNHRLEQKAEEFAKKIDAHSKQKDHLEKQLHALKSKLNGVDKKTVSMNEINAMVQEAEHIGTNVKAEIKKANDVMDEVKDLQLQWKDKKKLEDDKGNKVQKFKQIMKLNGELRGQMKKALATAEDKVNSYDTIYKAMVSSEDYAAKKYIFEKKMRRMAQLKQECGKLSDNEKTISSTFDKHSKLDIDKVDVFEIQSLIKEAENINAMLVQDVKELDGICNGFVKRRAKIGDADIKKIAEMRKQELKNVDDLMLKEKKRIDELENLFDQRKKDSTHKLSKDVEKEVSESLSKLKNNVYKSIRAEYDKVKEEVIRVGIDVNSKNLENEENFTKMSQLIALLAELREKIKSLQTQTENLDSEIDKRTTLLSSIDSENSLNTLVNDIHKDLADFKGIRDDIALVNEVCKNYEGYASGNDDEEFYEVLLIDGQEQNTDLKSQQNQYEALDKEISKIKENMSQTNKDNLTSDKVEDLNDKIEKFQIRVQKIRKQLRVVESNAKENVDRLSDHDLENKLERRGSELQELQKLLDEINQDCVSLQEQIVEEIEMLQEDEFYTTYITELRINLAEIETIVTTITEIMTEKVTLKKFHYELVERLRNRDKYSRIELLKQNLILKKRIHHCLKQMTIHHVTLKKAFQATQTTLSSKPVKKVVKRQIYKAAPGDEVDNILGDNLNKFEANVHIQKLGGGYYMFGTKKIFCKIINGKLVVRVGGGYMSIEEFIQQYGQAEAEKYNLQQMSQQAATSKHEGGSKMVTLSKTTTKTKN